MSSFKSFLINLLEWVLHIFFFLPVNRKKIVFRASNGDLYHCNPKYISEYITANCPNDFQRVWLFNRPADYAFLKEQGITVCQSNSPAAIFHLLTAKFVIDNIFPVSYIPYRKTQCVINTWHGGGSYKTGDSHEPTHRTQHADKMRKKANYRICSCERYMRRQINNGSIDEAHVLKYGSARNDCFFGDFSAMAKKAKDYYRIPENTGLILYTPTFRVYEMENLIIDIPAVTEACRKRFGKDFVFAYRMHKMIGKDDYLGIRQSGALDCSGYEDSQELIAAADIIITDYSSIVWDAGIAKKPCFLFAFDAEKYTARVKFDVPITEWPFPLCLTNEELVSRIEQFDEDAYLDGVAQHLDALGSYETGNCAAQTVAFMKQQTQKTGDRL